MDYKTLYEASQEENKKLKEQIDDLEGRLEDVNHQAEAWEDSYNELKEEKEKLEGDLETLEQAREGYEVEYSKLEEENKKLKEEHNKFDEIWKTEGITEQDIIDMKRQISNQCDLIKKLKNDIKRLKK